MLTFIAKRLGTSLLVLLLGSLLLFVLVINSGDPLGDLRESNDPNRENLIRQRINNMGLDKPWYVRYGGWLVGVSKCFIGRCDLGRNIGGQPVTGLVVQAAGSTLRLVVLASFLAIIIGVTLGVLSAIRQYSGFDYAITMMAFLFYSLPVFWAAVLLKHYAAIEFNTWLATAEFSLVTILIFALITAVVLQAALGGSWKRRVITGAVTCAVVAGAMLYFDAVTWFRRPAIGIPVYILAVLAVMTLALMLTTGFGNKRVRNAVLTTGGIAIIGYSLSRGVLMSQPSTWLLLVVFLISIAVAVAAGQLLGGLAKSQATLASLIVMLSASLIAVMDLLLSNWASYIQMRPRPVPTIGAVTPNFTADYWGTWIDVLVHLALPTVVLTLLSIASYTRYTRASMLDVLGQDYIRTARSKGISERKVITRHALRNSLIPLATIVAFDFASLIGGAVITETVFGWQGMGKLFLTGLQAVDPYPVMAFFLVTGSAAVVMNMIADIAYAFLDPRITR